MAKNNNLTDFLTDIADAIREKRGTSDAINAQNFANEIAAIDGGGSTPSKPKWTGHADAEGLKAIGWTDEDIAYYQENGVNWNEEDDEWHKVTDDNKALSGVLTASNISSYKNRIVYLPKIDTSGVTTMYQMFYNCYSLMAIPMLDTSNVINMESTFENCYSLTCIPMLDTSKVRSMIKTFKYCVSLRKVPQWDIRNITGMNSTFSYCTSLTSIVLGDTPYNELLNSAFSYCYSLSSVRIGKANSNYNELSSIFSNCRALKYIEMNFEGSDPAGFGLSASNVLTDVFAKNVNFALNLNTATLLSKDSLLYLINNEAATSAITIKLASYAYDKWATDPDVVAALANHPNISLAK